MNELFEEKNAKSFNTWLKRQSFYYKPYIKNYDYLNIIYYYIIIYFDYKFILF